MIKKQNGITIVALVITIVMLLIITSISIGVFKGNNGILNRGSETKFKQELLDMQETLLLYHRVRISDSGEKYQPELLNSDYNKTVYDGKDENTNIYDILTTLKGSKFDGKLYIKDGEIVLIGNSFNKDEIDWAKKVEIVVDGETNN